MRSIVELLGLEGPFVRCRGRVVGFENEVVVLGIDELGAEDAWRAGDSLEAEMVLNVEAL